MLSVTRQKSELLLKLILLKKFSSRILCKKSVAMVYILQVDLKVRMNGSKKLFREAEGQI